VPSKTRSAKSAAKPKAPKPAGKKRRNMEEGAPPPAGSKLVVKQVKSGIGHAKTYRRTLRALGLRHHQAEIVVRDNPSIRGMLAKVHHLVSVRPQEA
jgi:large subunit ribosomal protein L30